MHCIKTSAYTMYCPDTSSDSGTDPSVYLLGFAIGGLIALVVAWYFMFDGKYIVREFARRYRTAISVALVPVDVWLVWIAGQQLGVW